MHYKKKYYSGHIESLTGLLYNEMGDSMYTMERFVQGTILIIILTIYGAIHSEVPFLCMLVAGVLLCVICERSMEEEQELRNRIVQLVLTVLFVGISKGYLSYLIFYEWKISKDRYIETAFPTAAYFLTQIILRQDTIPIMICRGVLLAGISGLMYILELLIEKYIAARNQVAQAVSITSVNEMYAKKLAQELVIKNYLADKNARLEERETISRNIHNSVGHSITAAIMTLDAADMLFETAPEKAREKMNTANERIRTSLDSIRQAVRVLDNENKYVSIYDFISELTAVTDSFVMDTMINVYTDFGNVQSDVIIPHEHTEFLTGAMQELLSNGVRHGKADVFTVTLMADSRNIKMKVVDNGKSDFSLDNKNERIENGFGLKKIASYVRKCGGSVAFSNENGFKTEITLKLFKEDVNE